MTRITHNAYFVLACVFGAFLLGSLLHPVSWTPKRLSHKTEFAIAAPGVTVPPLDQQALDDLPNITLPGIGNIDDASYVARGAQGVYKPITAAPIPSDATIVLRGWAADRATKDAAGGLFLILDGKERVDESASYGSARPDVAAFLKNPKLARTGYAAGLAAARLGPGPHTLQVGIIGSDQQAYYTFPIVVHVRVAGA
jgi:hypothetical protein